jgi:hypothetical protein
MEERLLFPHIERTLEPPVLDQIGAQLAETTNRTPRAVIAVSA